MADLIKALQLLMKYSSKIDDPYPTHCEHDVLCVMNVAQGAPSNEDLVELERLGFHWSDEYDCWASFKFGSA